MNKMQISKFQNHIWDFYRINRRDLPWRNTKDPYKILLSEIMLQQTQVSRVLPKYEAFIEKFPNIKSLANSSFERVLRYWSGLGYNRRALFLQKTVRTIGQTYNGVVPQDENKLVELPGIGKNTAASIIVFSYNKPLVFIETNIRRVFIHHFFQDKTEVHDDEILKLVTQTLDQKNPRDWYYALMDYGSYLAKQVINPNRRSKHYAKQSKFEGSLRQVRGLILKLLLTKKTMKIDQLKKEVNLDSALFNKAVEQLEKEGFLEKDTSAIRLR